MQQIIKKKIGKRDYSFMVEGDNFHAVIMESQKLSFNDVTKCGKCESDNLVLSAYETKEEKFPYTKVLCLHCKASITFGQRKQGDIFYLRRIENSNDLDWQEFKGKDDEAKSQTQRDNPAVDNDKQKDDLPF